MKVSIYTLGCKVNQYESGGIYEALCQKGYDVVDKMDVADVYVINTCAVTAEAERKSRNAVTKCLAQNPNAKIYVVGCASQHNGDKFVGLKNVEYIGGNSAKMSVIDAIEKLTEKICYDAPLPLVYEDDFVFANSKTRAFIKVQDGCNNFCTYCIVPYLRGRSRSRSIGSVVSEISKLTDCNEVVLSGINLSDYSFGLDNLSEAIDKLGIRFRFGSLEVGIITEKFLACLARLHNFCPQFHLSLQSGSNRILKSMNRHYTREEYVCACNMIYATFPNAAITTDIIVGFPSESEEDFYDTVQLCKEVDFSFIHIFPYSKREGTVASKFVDLSKDVKKKRENILSEVRDELSKKYIAKFIGKALTVLTETDEGGYLVGYTENYLRAYVNEKLCRNKLYKIKIIKPLFDGVYGEIIEE